MNPPTVEARSAPAFARIAARIASAAELEWRPRLAALALLGVLVTALLLAIGAAAHPSNLVRGSEVAWPDWLSGPFGGLGQTPDRTSFSLLMLGMFAGYLGALAWGTTLPARWVLGAIGAAHLTLALAPPLMSGDLFGYLAYARLEVLHGLNPYTHASDFVRSDPVNPFVAWHNLPSPYGPLFTLGSLPLAWLGVPAGMWTLKALAAAASLGCVALTWRLADRLGRPPLTAAVFVGLNPLLLVYAVGGAHNDLFMMLLALAGISAMVAGRQRAAAGLTVAAAMVKASAALLLPFLVLGAPDRRRALLAVAGCGAAGGALALLLFGPHFLDVVLGRQLFFEGGGSVPAQFGRLLGVGLTPAIQAVGTTLLALSLAYLIRAAWRGADWLWCAGWATLALLTFSSWLLVWYVAWILPLAAISDDRRLKAGTLALCAFLLAIKVPLLLA